MPSHTAFYTSGCFTITSLIAREKLAMNMHLVDMSSRVNELLIPHFAHARYSTCDFIDKRVFFTPASEVTACDYYYLAAQACIESVHY